MAAHQVPRLLRPRPIHLLLCRNGSCWLKESPGFRFFASAEPKLEPQTASEEREEVYKRVPSSSKILGRAPTYAESKIGLSVPSKREQVLKDEEEEDEEEEVDQDVTRQKGTDDDLDNEVDVAKLESELKELEARGWDADPRIADVCLQLAQAYDLMQEDPEKILMHAQKAMKIYGAGSDEVEVGVCWHMVGASYVNMGKFEQGMSHLNRALSLLEKKQNEGHDVEVVIYAVHSSLGIANLALGRHSQAIEHLNEGLAIQEALFDEDDPRVGTENRRIAQAYCDAMSFKKALPYCEKALAIHRKAPEDCLFEEAADHKVLAMIQIGLNKHEKGLAHLQLARDMLLSSGDKEELRSVNTALANCQLMLEKTTDAIVTLEGICSEADKNSTDPVNDSILHATLAKAYQAQKNAKSAKDHCGKALELLNSCDNLDASGKAGALIRIASVYENLNMLDKAVDLLKDSKNILEKDPLLIDEVVQVESQIGTLFSFIGKLEESLVYYTSALQKLETKYGENHKLMPPLLNSIALANMEMEKYMPAVEILQRAKQISSNVKGESHPDTVAIIKNLERALSWAKP